VFGFGGVRDFDGDLSITPHLPAAWESLDYSLRVRDRQLRVHPTHDEERYLLDEGDPLELAIRGEMRLLRKGHRLSLRTALV
jgi:alpha,alpha-trehalose phosphorylase